MFRYTLQDAVDLFLRARRRNDELWRWCAALVIVGDKLWRAALAVGGIEPLVLALARLLRVLEGHADTLQDMEFSI
jgi:hypothetical protein